MGFRSQQHLDKQPVPLEVQHTPSFEKEDKWKLASELQKCVRQGLSDRAARVASSLHEIDAAYLRYRMSVIAVEDVAAANPGLIAQAVSDGWGKKAIEAKGGAAFLIAQASEWAKSVKDRTPCTWMDCAYFLPKAEQQYGPMIGWTNELSLRLVQEGEWWERGLAAWRMIGTDKIRSDHLIEMPGLDPEWFLRLPLNENQIAVIRFGLSHQREAHPIFLPLAFETQSEETQTVKVNDLMPPSDVGTWLASALDGHTSEGKRAIYTLIDMYPDRVKQLGVSRDAAFSAIRKLMFWAEGGKVDKALLYPTAVKIDKESKQVRCKHIGVSPQQLWDLFGPHVADWEGARKKAMGISKPRSTVKP